MNKELRDAIIKVVQENKDEFQIVNYTKGIFKNYIYDQDGNYLIGGQEVAQFISDFIALYINN